MAKGACAAGLALLAGLAGVAAGAGTAAAADLVAMVEAVEGGSPEVQELEPLEVGRELALGRGDRVVIGYLDSCAREVVAGPGVVRIGAANSTLESGASLVDRRTVDCRGSAQAGLGSGNSAALRLRSIKPANQADAAGGGAGAEAFDAAQASRAMRAMRDRQTLGAATHRQPVLLLQDPARRVVLQPLENQGKSRELRAADALVDTGDGTGPLEPGLWLARRGEVALVFRVRDDAGTGQAPSAARLVRF
jgi:hypothetical protein